MSSDGGSVAERRKAEQIAHEIEQTRAELADTIDAIADRMSPKRAVARGTQKMRSRVSGGEPSPTAVIDLTETAAPAIPAAPAESGAPGVDPKLLAAGAAAGAAVGLLALRRKK
jgi:hypothetical protein